jgi:hypothetical protein
MRLTEGRVSIPGDVPVEVRHGHPHFWQRALSRRVFVKGALAATGAVVGARPLWPALAAADEVAVAPKPLTYGFQPSPGGPTFRFSMLDADSELSSITDFKGMVGAADVQGAGTSTRLDGTTERLLFDSDMRFMKGVYIGIDGRRHRGTFAFV